MASSFEVVKRIYQLSETEKQNIGDIIIEDCTDGVTPVKKPVAIILGGQPGAGKSELTTQAQIMTGKNAVICNADDYRDYHPKAKEIKQKFEGYYPGITVEYSQPWNNRLKEHCEVNRYNYIMETTFSSGNLMNETILDLKNKGYTVYLLVVAVNKRLSYLGTKLRYESMKSADGYGRLVDRAIHDEKYERVDLTLQLVHEAHLYDRLVIYGRAGRQKVKGMRNGLIMLSDNGEDPVTVYRQEREKEWSDNDLRYFNDDVLYLIRQMVNRKAPYEDIKDVLDSFQVGLGKS